jgi:hypothetical protein
MDTIKLYNASHVDMKELSNELGVESGDILIDLSDKYIVYKNDMGFEIMTKSRLTEYAYNLIQAHPEMYEGRNYSLFSFDDLIEVINTTLDNERVYKIESSV